MAKIILVVPVFPKLSETFIVNKFLGLLDLGYDITVAAQRLDLAAWSQFQQLKHRPELQQRVHAHECFAEGSSFNIPSGRRLHTTTANFWRLMRYKWKTASPLSLNTFLESIRSSTLIARVPSIIHFEFGALAVNRAWIGKALGCKVVLSFRGYDLNFVGLESADYYEDVWRHADAIHCLGWDLWTRARRRGCPETMEHALIPPAIDTDLFSRSKALDSAQAGDARRPLRIISVGRLEWKKGYEYALQTVKLLRDRGIETQYRIIGTGEYLEAVTYCRHQLGLESCVTLLGAATQQEVRDEMENADVLMHAAVSEGFCNAVLEAQAMELPVVTSDADGLAENVEDGRTGFVTKRRDPNALANALERLALDGKLRVAMGAAGRTRVNGRFRLSQQIKALDGFYQQLLRDGTEHRVAAAG